METCFSRVTKRPACIYQGDLTPQPACRLPDFPFPFVSGSSSINTHSQGELFLFPRPNLERFLLSRAGNMSVPQPFHTSKALWRKLPMAGTWLREIFFSFFFSLPVPQNLPPLLLKQLTLARKMVSGFRWSPRLHIIKPNVITFVRGEAPSHSGVENEGREQ